jgi:hypothetical protein
MDLSLGMDLETACLRKYGKPVWNSSMNPRYFLQKAKNHESHHKTLKVKGTANRPEGPEGSRGIALLFLDLGARREWVSSLHNLQ